MNKRVQAMEINVIGNSQFAGKLRHLRGQFKKARADGIPVKLPPQKQIVSTDMEVEGDLNQKLQRWFSLSAFHISEMFDTDIELLGFSEIKDVYLPQVR
jgi:hypothetical protein